MRWGWDSKRPVCAGRHIEALGLGLLGHVDLEDLGDLGVEAEAGPGKVDLLP